MTTNSSRLRACMTALALPVGGLALSYAMLIDYPLRQSIRDVQTKIARLNETLKQRKPEQIAKLAALEQAQKSERELQKLVSTVATPPAPQPTEPSESSLIRLSGALDLFDRHDVRCIGSQPLVSKSDSKQSPPPMTDSGQISLTLAGRFCDFHSAITELQSSPSGVAIVSINMEPAADGSAIHRWLLILQP